MKLVIVAIIFMLLSTHNSRIRIIEPCHRECTRIKESDKKVPCFWSKDLECTPCYPRDNPYVIKQPDCSSCVRVTFSAHRCFKNPIVIKLPIKIDPPYITKTIKTYIKKEQTLDLCKILCIVDSDGQNKKNSMCLNKPCTSCKLEDENYKNHFDHIGKRTEDEFKELCTKCYAFTDIDQDQTCTFYSKKRDNKYSEYSIKDENPEDFQYNYVYWEELSNKRRRRARNLN